MHTPQASIAIFVYVASRLVSSDTRIEVVGIDHIFFTFVAPHLWNNPFLRNSLVVHLLRHRYGEQFLQSRDILCERALRQRYAWISLVVIRHYLSLCLGSTASEYNRGTVHRCSELWPEIALDAYYHPGSRIYRHHSF